MWKNEDLTKLVTVLPDGRVFLPLIGEITAAGKTVGELVRALNAIGVTPRDLITILQSMKAAEFLSIKKQDCRLPQGPLMAV